MKIGFVSLSGGGLVPTVRIELHSVGDSPRTVDALLESGFTGAVSLPLRDVLDLKLNRSGEHLVILADASEISVHLYEGFIGFAGKRYRCAVLATGDVPTVGMHLMKGLRVCFEAVEDGDIEIEASNA